ALQQRLLEGELQPGFVGRVEADKVGIGRVQVELLVVGRKRDADHATGRHRLVQTGTERSVVPVGGKGVDRRFVLLAPGRAGRPQDIKASQGGFNLRAGDGRIEREGSYRVGRSSWQILIHDAGKLQRLAARGA